AYAAPAVIGLPDFADIVDRTGPAVVNIRTTERAKVVQAQDGSEDEEMQELLRRFSEVKSPHRNSKKYLEGSGQVSLF
ncbi:hypothetical protein, partial [Sphingomonas sp. 10B4]|uniref:hypothetical protein n=1 Tax=Sphingomonas sp. 10B4 TaxID=3048575 RepID=UPI002B225EB5